MMRRSTQLAGILIGIGVVGAGLSLQTPLVVKYRDEKTDLATALEQWLR